MRSPWFSVHPPLCFGILVILFGWACSSPAPEFSGPYLGQQPPGAEARLFAPGIVNTGLYTRDLAMTPEGDEIFFGVSTGGFHYATIAHTRLVNGRWTPPEIAPFCRDPRFMDAEPFITPDGSRLLFLSNRPRPGQQAEEANEDIWAVDRTDEGWGEPYNLGPPVCSDAEEYFPSVTRDGTLYFTRSSRELGGSFIYRSWLVDGAYQEPERLPEQVNHGNNQFNAFIAPDESYLILPTVREDSLGGLDYYISFLDEKGQFSELVNMGPSVNSSDRAEWSASLSPDGRYLFFMSGARTGRPTEPNPMTWDALQDLHDSPRSGAAKIYWVDAGFIDSLRPR